MNIILLSFAVISAVVPHAVARTTCDVVPIELWGTSPLLFTRALPRPVELVVITHTVTSDCFTDADCVRISRAIRSAHIQQGYEDIRLSFLVGGNGKIYEGTGWNVGRHSTGYNDRSISLSFIGDFTNKLPTEAALKAAEQFMGCYLNTRYLGCEYNVVGHRQLIHTISPGDALQNLIQTWPHWTNDVSKLSSLSIFR